MQNGAETASDSQIVDLVKLVQAELDRDRPTVGQQFTLKRLLLISPLLAMFLSLPAATWSPGAELHVILLFVTGYSFVMTLALFPLTLFLSLMHWIFAGDRSIAFRVATRTHWVMFLYALVCLSYLAYSYCIALVNGT